MDASAGLKVWPPWIALLLSIIVGCAVFRLTTLRPLSAPRLALSTQALDLGDGRPRQPMIGPIELANFGTAPLDFSITRSCGCTNVAPMAGTIHPGKRVAVLVTLTLPEHAGSERAVQVTVNSNDPDQPKAVCAVIARSPAPFRIEPRFLEFGSVLPQKLSETIGDFRLAKPTGEDRLIQARLTRGSFLVSAMDQQGISLAPKPTLPVGEYYDTLELSLEGDGSTVIRVPVRIQVSAPLMAIPSTVFLRKSNDGRSTLADWILVCDRSFPPLSNLRFIDKPEAIQIEETARLDKWRRRYRLIVPVGANIDSLQIVDEVSGLQCTLITKHDP